MKNIGTYAAIAVGVLLLIFIIASVVPGYNVLDFYKRYTNNVERRANDDAKEYLTQILNDPASYQAATNSVDSVFYTKQEMIDDYHKYSPEVEKTNYYQDLIGEHKLKEINVTHFYRAKNGFGAMTLGSLKMRYTPSALDKGRLDLYPLVLSNQ